MLTTRVIPVLLLHDSGLVKTVRFRHPQYVGDPINAVSIYNEKEVDELVFLDIAATKQRREPDYELLKHIASECFMPVCYGGGIRSLDQIDRILNLGIEKVAINSFVAENPKFLQEAARRFGSQSIVLSMDVKKTLLGRSVVKSHAASKVSKIEPRTYCAQAEKLGAGEILLNAIDRDGTWQGFDTALVRQIADAVSIPVIACGGAGTLEDLAHVVREGNASAVAIGSMAVYQGKGRGVLINFPSQDEIHRVFNAS